MTAWEEDGDFRSAIESDPAITKYLSPQAFEDTLLCFQTVTEHRPDLSAGLPQSELGLSTLNLCFHFPEDRIKLYLGDGWRRMKIMTRN